MEISGKMFQKDGDYYQNDKNHKERTMKESLGDKTVLPTPVWVVGTYDKVGKPNVMTAAWARICCSDPPAVMVALRKVTYTYENILNRKAFTVSVPSEKHIRETDYFGMVSGKDADKLAVSRRTIQRLEAGELEEPNTKAIGILLDQYLVALDATQKTATSPE